MSNTAKVSTTFSQKSTAKKPLKARQSPEEKIKALEKKKNQIAEQIKNQKAKIAGQKRKEDTRRKIVAGAIALEHMTHDENFRHVMEGLLKKHVKESDLHLFEI